MSGRHRLHQSANGQEERDDRDSSAKRSICRRDGSAIARRARASRSSSSTATWSTGGSGTASSTALSDRYRCLAPDWPIGAQQIAMNPDADLSPPGIAATIASFLEALDLEDVTIVGNDSGGAMSQVLVTRHPERIGRLVLTNCDTHENFPPGIFKAMPPLAKLPGGMTVLSRARSGSAPSPAPPSRPSPGTRSRRPGRLLAGARDERSRRQARPEEGDRRDEQALHAGGGGEAARLRAADPARLGPGRQTLPDRLRRTAGR